MSTTTPYIVYKDPGHGTSVMDVMKIGNIVPRVGIKPTSLAFRASVKTITTCRLPDVTTILMPTCLNSSLSLRSVQTITILRFSLFIALKCHCDLVGEKTPANILVYTSKLICYVFTSNI